MRPGTASITRFHFSVVIAPHLADWAVYRARSLVARCARAIAKSCGGRAGRRGKQLVSRSPPSNDLKRMMAHGWPERNGRENSDSLGGRWRRVHRRERRRRRRWPPKAQKGRVDG